MEYNSISLRFYMSVDEFRQLTVFTVDSPSSLDRWGKYHRCRVHWTCSVASTSAG